MLKGDNSMEDQLIKPEEKKTGITIRDTQVTSILNPEIYTQMKALAKDFVDSKAIPSCWTTPAQVLVGLQTGVEMGMKPMEAMNSLYVVNGSVNIWGKAVTRRIREHGYAIKYTGESDEQVTATVTKGTEKYSFTFKFKDAVDSGYTKDNYGKDKIGWRAGQNRLLKLRYGALSALLKTEIPEVLGVANGIAEIDGDISEPTKASVDEDEIKRIAGSVVYDAPESK
jgi:hypothetical protein